MLIKSFVVFAGKTPATGDGMDANVQAAAVYLQAARRLGIPRVLLASSSAVYCAGTGQPMHEEEACHPNSFYGA